MLIDIASTTSEREQLWRAHAGELIRYATLLVGPNDAADVVSAAFLQTAATRTDVANARAYLFRTVTNRAIDRQRSALRRQARDLHAVLPTVARTDDTDLDIRRAVARLSVQQRAVVYFTYWEDLTDDAVGELLGISPGSVRQHLGRARLRLRKVLQ